MKLSSTLLKSLDWTLYTGRFIRTNFLIIFGLGLLAAFGRAIQLKAFGPISPVAHVLLEIMIESARILLFFFTLGLANIRIGLTRLFQFFTSKASRRQNWQISVQKMRENWSALLINLVVFLLIALLFNALIDHIAYETCLFITLQARQLISPQSSEWALILFFKNLSVIPFTLIFEALFFLWITNRLPKSMA